MIETAHSPGGGRLALVTGFCKLISTASLMYIYFYEEKIFTLKPSLPRRYAHVHLDDSQQSSVEES
jgi:hypothetical protein